MSRIYEDRAYQADSLNGCFWAEDYPRQDLTWPEVEGAIKADVAIIGAGYTGLSAALHLANAGVDVAVVDMHAPGWGASGRNGGFCCRGGGMAGEAGITRRFGADGYADWEQAQKDSVQLVAELLETQSIDAKTHSNGETMLAHSRAVSRFLERQAEAKAKAGEPVAFISTSELAEKGMNANGLFGGYTEPVGFALHPRRYILGLAEAVRKSGGRIYAQAPVSDVKEHGPGHVLQLPNGTLTAKQVIFATNGYSRDDMPAWMGSRYMPVQSNILVTRQLTDAEISAQGWHSDQMVYDTRSMLHYFRLMPDRRMLFGMRGGIQATERSDRKMHRLIRRDFERMFPAWAHVETPWFWTGLVCLNSSGLPYVGLVPTMKGVYSAFGWHGNGVAMATYAGRAVARLVLGLNADIPQVMQQPPKRMPFGGARRGLLIPAYAGLGLLDRFA